MKDTTKELADLILRHESSIKFTILEIGAAPLGGAEARFHQLIDLFPGSQILAFEVDKTLCEDLNKKARPGITFFPIALGRSEETRAFYETRKPMCSSLYKPNEKLISLYNNFQMAHLESVREIDTVSLDHFAKENKISPVDFIKIDVQGAELDIFQGARKTLRDVLAIVTEVEFIPHYIDQPLFGDVCSFLAKENFMFHKFLELAGRSLSPIVVEKNNPNKATQHIWSDAIFIRDIFKIPELMPDKLLKLGMLAFLYHSPDLTYYCFHHYDTKNGTDLKGSFLKLGS